MTDMEGAIIILQGSIDEFQFEMNVKTFMNFFSISSYQNDYDYGYYDDYIMPPNS